jgi:hypothetical protein
LRKIVRALFGILIGGGINRTQAKITEAGGSNINRQNDAASKGQRDRNGFRSDSGKRNNLAPPADETDNSYGTGDTDHNQGDGSRRNGRGGGSGNDQGGLLTAPEIGAWHQLSKL